MNNTTAIVGGVVALALIGGLVYYVTRDDSPLSSTATSTPTSSSGGGSSSGSGEPSQPTPAAVPSVPSATTNSSATMTDTTAVVSGSVIPNGAATTYWFEYGLTSNLGSKTSNQTIGSGYRSTPAPGFITGLTKDTVYYFRLAAQNSQGKAVGIVQTFRTTVGNPPPVGDQPTVRTTAASGVGRNAATLSGEVTPNQAATSYWFEYGKSTSLGSASALTAVGSGSAKVAASLTLSDLDPATTYYFRLNAQNQFGTVNSTILSFKTLNPASGTAPSVSTLSAADIATTTVTLRASVDANGLDTMYWFEYSTDSLLGSVLLSSTPQKSAGSGANPVSVDTNLNSLAPDTDYYFRAVAQNSLGVARGERMTFKTN